MKNIWKQFIIRNNKYRLRLNSPFRNLLSAPHLNLAVSYNAILIFVVKSPSKFGHFLSFFELALQWLPSLFLVYRGLSCLRHSKYLSNPLSTFKFILLWKCHMYTRCELKNMFLFFPIRNVIITWLKNVVIYMILKFCNCKIRNINNRKGKSLQSTWKKIPKKMNVLKRYVLFQILLMCKRWYQEKIHRRRNQLHSL